MRNLLRLADKSRPLWGKKVDMETWRIRKSQSWWVMESCWGREEQFKIDTDHTGLHSLEEGNGIYPSSWKATESFQTKEWIGQTRMYIGLPLGTKVWEKSLGHMKMNQTWGQLLRNCHSNSLAWDLMPKWHSSPPMSSHPSSAPPHWTCPGTRSPISSFLELVLTSVPWIPGSFVWSLREAGTLLWNRALISCGCN